VADDEASHNQAHRVEHEGVGHVANKVVRGVPEEDTPEPSGDASSAHVVLAGNSFFKSVVSVLPELVANASDLLFVSRSSLSEGHPVGSRSGIFLTHTELKQVLAVSRVI